MAMLPGMFLQIFVPCYVGNEISVEHNKLPASFFASNWIKFNVQQRKLLITAMESLKRENFIRMGQIFPLTLITFSKVYFVIADADQGFYYSIFFIFQIINLAYRLFALLQNI